MKRTLKFVLAMAMAMVMLMSGSAMAEGTFVPQGSIIAPGLVFDWVTRTKRTTPTIVLSNVSSENVTCKVVAYDGSGNDLTRFAQVFSGGTNYAIVSSGSAEFEIPAHESRMFHLSNINQRIATMGYATIEWKSEDTKQRNALVGAIYMHRGNNGQYTNHGYLLNNGKAF